MKPDHRLESVSHRRGSEPLGDAVAIPPVADHPVKPPRAEQYDRQGVHNIQNYTHELKYALHYVQCPTPNDQFQVNSEPQRQRRGYRLTLT